MATVKQRLDAMERQAGLAGDKIDRRAERVRFTGECMRGLHLDVFSLERIKEAKAMLESHCK